MYRSFYGLRERPFSLTPNPRYLVLTAAHREALSHLEYGIASRKGITLLLGEAGTGKTTLIRTSIERQPSRVHCVYLQNPALTRAEFVEMLAALFELDNSARQSKAALLLGLESLLKGRRALGESTVLVVDEAQSLPLDLLEEIRLLANIETDDEKLLSVILAGQPELAERLNRTELRQLKQRIALRCELRPLTAPETLAYIAGRIRAAGGVAGQIFSREAVMLMGERAKGIPRTISVIADNALVTGFALGQRPITADTVHEVCRDLDLENAEPEFPSEAASTAPASAAPVTAQPEAAAVSAPVAPPREGRILTFMHPGVEVPASLGPVENVPAPAADSIGNAAATAQGEMFAASAPKRRRFLFF